MATGTKSGYVDFTAANYGGQQTMRVHWQETWNSDTKQSDVSITRVELKSTAQTSYIYYADFILKINGVEAVRLQDYVWQAYLAYTDTFQDVTKNGDGVTQVTGTVAGIAHEADGSKSVNLTLHVNSWSYPGFWAQYYAVSYSYKFTDGDSRTIELTKLPVGTLTLTGSGATATVKRGGETLANGAALYSGDVLSVSVAANSGYAYPTVTVTGATKNGSSYTVGTGGVTVAAGGVRIRTLSRSQGAGTALSTQVTASPHRSVPVGISGASGTVYDGETVRVTGSLATGYQSLVLMQGGAVQDSGGFNVFISGDVSVSSSATKTTYTLTMPSGNYTLTVKRTSSPIGGAATGNLSNGATLYHNDVLQISVTAAAGYRITALKVNGADFQSGNSHTVTAAVTVAITAQAYAASDISITGSTMGSQITIGITRASSSFTHTLKWTFAGRSGTLVTRTGAASYAWTPDADTFGGYIPNATSGSCAITCETWDGSTLVGTAVKSFALSVPADAAPAPASGWSALSYTNSGTAAGALTVPVKGCSILRWTLDRAKISLKYGASLSSVTAVYGRTTVSRTASGTYDLGAAEAVSNAVTVTVTDSRGKTASESVSLTVRDYAKPSLGGVSVFRCDEDGVSDDGGAYYSARAVAVYSSLEGQNSAALSVQIRAAGGSYGAAESLESGVARVLGGSLSATRSYVVRLTVTDALGNTGSTEQSVPTSAVTFNLKDGGQGAAFGKYAEEDGLLDVAWGLRAAGPANLTGGSTVHDAAGTGGTAGFVRVATITVTGPYANVPITITFARRRDSAPTTLFITFLSAANTDPGLAYFTGTGPNPGAAQLVKRAASTWDLYVEKTEPWDRLAITEYHLTAYMQGLATVAWTDEQVNTDPGGTAASPAQVPGTAALKNRVYGTELTVAVGHDLHGLLLTDVGSVHIVWVASGRIYCTEIWNGGNTDTLTATWDSGTKTATFSYTNSHGMVYMGY